MATDGGDYIPALRFARLTRLYDPVLRLTMREATIKRALVAQMHVTGGQRVLDLGCGTGTLMLLIKATEPEAEVVGIDGDPDVLAIARLKAAARGMELHFDEGMAYALPYSDGAFDRVVTSLVLHHLTRRNKERALRGAHRVLQPGGELHIADFGKPHDPLMRAVSWVVRWFEETRDNIQGLLPALAIRAGFSEVLEPACFRTVLGTVSLYSARKRR